MGARTLALVVTVAMAVLAAAPPALAAHPTIHVSSVTLRASGVVVKSLPRGPLLTFSVKYKIRRLSTRSHYRTAVTVQLRRLTSRFNVSTARSALYAESGTYVWPVGGDGVRMDARYPAGLYRMTVRVRLLRPSGRVVASSAVRSRVRVV